MKHISSATPIAPAKFICTGEFDLVAYLLMLDFLVTPVGSAMAYGYYGA
jgi:hypothetical protein